MPNDDRTPEGWVPRPDPTLLTTEALKLAVDNLRNEVEKDTSHLRRDLDRLEEAQRDAITSEVGNLRDVCSEKFSSFEFRFAGVQQQFQERDERVEQSARSNRELVEAALAAQKEAVGKNETTTTEQLRGIQSQLETSIGALRQQLDDLKERIGVTTVQVGTGEGERVGRDKVQATMIALAGIVVGVIAVIASIVISNSP